MVSVFRHTGRRPYLHVHDDAIRRMNAEGRTDVEIANALGCAVNGVQYRRRVKMGLPSNSNRPWTRKEEQRAVELAKGGMTRRAIAAVLDRSWSSLDNRLQRLGGGDLDHRKDRYHQRCLEAWELLHHGLSTKETAERLGVNARTVRRYRRRMPKWWWRTEA